MNKVVVGVLAAVVPCLAQAVPLYSDNFNSDTPGLDNTPSAWTISNGGTVDTIANGDFGITCFGATGNCIDLDGTTGKSGNLTSPGLTLTAGDTYTATFELSGNQRLAQTDVVAVNFGTTATSFSVAEATPFTLESVTFKPLSSGTYSLSFLDNSSNDVGAILDSVSIAAVPEPSTYAMLVAGMIVMSFAFSRRVRKPI